MEQTAGTLGIMRAVVMVRQERVAGVSAGSHASSWACCCSVAVLEGLGGTPTPVWSVAGATG